MLYVVMNPGFFPMKYLKYISDKGSSNTLLLISQSYKEKSKVHSI